MPKDRSGRGRAQQIVQSKVSGPQGLTQRQKRENFKEWNRGFRNPDTRNFHQAYWDFKVRRKSGKAPDHIRFGVRKTTADSSKDVIDSFLK